MSDVTAVALSIGEPSISGAIASVRRQSLLPKEIVLVENVFPFHLAWNRAASQVRTEFFVQVDADFILDEDCLSELRVRMTDGVGVVSAPLRDALMGAVDGVKLFRTECLKRARFRDSISPDTDFCRAIQEHGYRHVRHADPRSFAGPPIRTLGEHRPDYTPLYTYSKYRLLGRRYRYRRDAGTFRWRARELAKNRLPVAFFAQVGLSHGIFGDEERDLLRPYTRDRDFEILQAFASSTADGISNAAVEVSDLLSSDPSRTNCAFRECGSMLCQRRCIGGFRSSLNALSSHDESQALIARIGLCQGIYARSVGPDALERELAILRELIGA